MDIEAVGAIGGDASTGLESSAEMATEVPEEASMSIDVQMSDDTARTSLTDAVAFENTAREVRSADQSTQLSTYSDSSLGGALERLAEVDARDKAMKDVLFDGVLNSSTPPQMPAFDYAEFNSASPEQRAFMMSEHQQANQEFYAWSSAQLDHASVRNMAAMMVMAEIGSVKSFANAAISAGKQVLNSQG